MVNRRSISKGLQTQTIFGRPLTIKSTVGGVLRTHSCMCCKWTWMLTAMGYAKPIFSQRCQS
jgi:hypothetical protein